MKKEYLSEEKYVATVKKLKTASIILLCCSAVFVIGAILAAVLIKVPSMSADGWFEKNSLRMFSIFGCVSVAIFTAMGSLSCFMMAKQRSIAAFAAQQTLPITAETINKTAENIDPAMRSTMRAYKSVMDEAKKENANFKSSADYGDECGSSESDNADAKTVSFCRHCGKKVPKDSAFCPYCGKNIN